jgi:hypothetical protein
MPADEWFANVRLNGGRIVAVGAVQQGDTQVNIDDVLVRLQNNGVFRGTFD